MFKQKADVEADPVLSHIDNRKVKTVEVDCWRSPGAAANYGETEVRTGRTASVVEYTPKNGSQEC